MPSDEKVTVMILAVDLKCSCCYKKVKKLLCKFPQIRDQVFDEDKNKVMITVVCCDPEKLRDKLCRKGGGAIQSIEIVEKRKQPPSEPVETEKPKQTSRQTEEPKQKQLEKKTSGKSDPKPNSPPKQPDPPLRVSTCCQECSQGLGGGPCHYGYGRPVPPVSTCCQECSQGLGGGPCHYGYGRPVPPPPGPCYDGYPYGGSRPCYVSRCDYYFCEENPQGCSIM